MKKKKVLNFQKILQSFRKDQKKVNMQISSTKQKLRAISTGAMQRLKEYDDNKGTENAKFIELQSANKRFQIEYENLIPKAKKQQNLEHIFVNLTSHYKSKGYKIPDLTTDHNLFKPSILLLESNEIGDYYKIHKIKKKDKNEEYMKKIESNARKLRCKRAFGETNDDDKKTETIETMPTQRNEGHHFDTLSDQQLNTKRSSLSLANEQKSLLKDIIKSKRSLEQLNKNQSSLTIRTKKPILCINTQNEEMMKSEPSLRTISTHHESNITCQGYLMKTKKVSCFNIKESLTTKESNKDITNFRRNKDRTKTVMFKENQLSRNKRMNNYFSHSKMIKNSSIIDSLTTQEQFKTFFKRLGPDDIFKYNFDELGKSYCNKCLKEPKKSNIERLYTK